MKCGRRWGKTEICQYLIAEIVAKQGKVAYLAPTYKDLHEVWNDTKDSLNPIIRKKDESVKQIICEGGAKIDFWSIEDPDSGRGRKYNRVIFDECEKAKKFQESWEESIRATLTDYRGDAYFLSTPKFGDTYFKRLFKYEKDGWESFKFTTYDNPYMSHEEIEEAKQLLDPAIFDCEYLAEDLDGKASNPFAYQFDSEFHVSSRAIFIPQKQIYVGVDFNLNPFAVTFSHFWQDRDGIHQWVFDEASIQYGSIPDMVDLINQKYGRYVHNFIITGDAMGKRGDLSQRDNASYYDQLARGLNVYPHQLKIYPNPSHENSRADVNWVLHRSKSQHEFIMHPDGAEGAIYDMKYVQVDAYGKLLKKSRTDLTQRADFLDTIRYKINAFWKPFIK